MSAESDRFEASMNARKQRMIEAARPALEKGASELQATMKSLVPKDTGALAESIKITPPGQTTPAYSTGGQRAANDNEVLITAGNTEVRYGHLVEFGTAKAHAQPFFYLAYRLQKKRIADRIKRALRKALKNERADAS